MLLALLVSAATANTYTSTYGGNPNHSISVEIGSSHLFRVGICPADYHVRWYLTYSGGGIVDEDSSSFPFYAEFSRSFQNPGTDWVRAEVYNETWIPVETHRWQVDVLAPDLIVEDIWTDPAQVIEGETYRIYARIRNVGDVVASVALGSQDARFRVDGGTVDIVTYDDVAPDGSVEIQTGLLSPLSSGTHSVQVEADYNNEVDEAEEGNNLRGETLPVIPPPLPDLIVESISINPGYAWRPTTVSAVVRNIGDAAAEFGLMDRICRFEVDGQLGYDDTFLSTLTIPPGGSYLAEKTFTVSSLGSLSVAALADPDNEIVEEFEGNNSRTESETWTASTIHDTDGDGMLDADEVIAGSDPTNISNVWECAVGSTNGGFMITWPSISNRWYAVERTFNLTNDFVVIASNLPATPPKNSYLDTAASNAFYRIEVSE